MTKQICDADTFMALTNETRLRTINECATWLAMHCMDYKPEFLAGEMAKEMLKPDNQ